MATDNEKAIRELRIAGRNQRIHEQSSTFRKLTDAQLEEAAAMFKAGATSRQVGKALGVSHTTAAKIAALRGYELDRARVIAATNARVAYTQERRCLLIDAFFDKLGRMLNKVSKPQELQQLAATLGILIEKRRLEDGDATSRTEVTGDDVRERILGKLASLSARTSA